VSETFEKSLYDPTSDILSTRGRLGNSTVTGASRVHCRQRTHVRVNHNTSRLPSGSLLTMCPKPTQTCALPMILAAYGKVQGQTQSYSFY